MKPVKCGVCHNPLELIFQDLRTERYRCTMCGKQETVEIPVKPSISEEIVENG